MNLKQILFIFFVIILHYRCNPDCRGEGLVVPLISFSIMDTAENDLIGNGLYDPFFIELRTTDNDKIQLNFEESVIPHRVYISNYNTSLEALNDSDYFLHLSNSDTDTIRMNVTQMFDQCDNPYYESNSFTHNGILLNESIFSNSIESHFILIKE